MLAASRWPPCVHLGDTLRTLAAVFNFLAQPKADGVVQVVAWAFGLRRVATTHNMRLVCFETPVSVFAEIGVFSHHNQTSRNCHIVVMLSVGFPHGVEPEPLRDRF